MTNQLLLDSILQEFVAVASTLQARISETIKTDKQGYKWKYNKRQTSFKPNYIKKVNITQQWVSKQLELIKMISSSLSVFSGDD